MNNTCKRSFKSVLHSYNLTAKTHYPVGKGVPQLLHFGRRRSFDSGGFQSILQDFDSFAKYGKVDVNSSYHELPRGSKHYLDRLQEKITSDEMKQMKEQGLFGKLEESADILFEMYTLQFMRQDIVPHKELDAMKARFDALKSKQANFHVILKEFRNRLTSEQVQSFQKLTGLDEKQSRHFLALICIKFMLLKNKAFDTVPEVRRRIMSETQELTEGLPFYSLKKLLLSFNSLTVSRLPFVPLAWSRKLLEWYARKTLKRPVTYQDMMHYVFIKQMGRQELHYEKPNLTYLNRKSIVKPFETMVEAAILKEAAERSLGRGKRVA